MDVTMIPFLWVRELRHRVEKLFTMERQSLHSSQAAPSGTPLTHSIIGWLSVELLLEEPGSPDF